MSESRIYTRYYDSLEEPEGIRYHSGLFSIMEAGMSPFSSATVLSLVDSMAILLAQASHFNSIIRDCTAESLAASSK